MPRVYIYTSEWFVDVGCNVRLCCIYPHIGAGLCVSEDKSRCWYSGFINFGAFDLCSIACDYCISFFIFIIKARNGLGYCALLRSDRIDCESTFLHIISLGHSNFITNSNAAVSYTDAFFFIRNEHYFHKHHVVFL